MTLRLPHLASAGFLAALCGVLVGVTPRPAASQNPPPAAGDAGGNGMEVLARGPIHEAFAASVEQPSGGGPVIPKAPPDAIEELPPDQKPDGDNVQWIPGYWSWDDERQDFLWVSGLWRNAPPNRVWVPGGWRQAAGGSQWVHGFWQEVQPAAAPGQPQQLTGETQYLPPPPEPLETGPVAPSPDPSNIYIPGSWVWRNHYVWRPGVWAPYRADWVWVNAHYRWTPAGYIFVDGYWDYPLATRGVLYAPVYFTQPVYAQPAFAYSPTYVVAEPCLYGSLFLRRGYGSYYFGDYFEPRYAGFGFTAWNGIGVGGLSINVGIGGRRGYFYDPLWSYYRASYRNDPTWAAGVNGLYVGRYQGTIVRPPQTFVQQTTVVNNITNNNVTIVNKNVTNNIATNKVVNNVNNVTMLTTMNNIHHTTSVAGQTAAVRLQPVPQAARAQERTAARQYQQVAAARTQAETRLVTQGGPPAKATDAPRTAHFAVPQALVARAQAAPQNPAFVPPPKPVAHTAAQAATPLTKPAHPNLQPPAGTPPLTKPPATNFQPPTNPPPKPVAPPSKPANPNFQPPVPPAVPPKPVAPPQPKVVPPQPVAPPQPKPVAPPQPFQPPPKPVTPPPPKFVPPQPPQPKAFVQPPMNFAQPAPHPNPPAAVAPHPQPVPHPATPPMHQPPPAPPAMHQPPAPPPVPHPAPPPPKPLPKKV